MAETIVTSPKPVTPIELSLFSDALLKSLKSIKPKVLPDDMSKITVSQTVSFLALAYERIRNAVEYREDHLIRRAAIERIMRRRLSLNPSGKGEAENLLRELLWARYFVNGSLGGQDIIDTQQVIDKFVIIRGYILVGRNITEQQYLSEFLFQLLTCEIEERLSPEDVQKESSKSYFIYQVLRRKIKIEGLTEDQKDAYFLAAIEKAYKKSDVAYQRYHFFVTFYEPIYSYTNDQIKDLSSKLPKVFTKIDEMIKNPYVNNLVRYTRKQLPPFLILFEVIKNKFLEIDTLISNKNALWEEVELTCRTKYQYVSSRLRVLAVRSFIYIFLTKMVFAIILEVPVSNYFYHEVSPSAIIINSIFPPILMVLIVFFFRLPNDDNTKKIFQRIIDIIDKNKSFETQVAYIPKKPRDKKPLLVFGFTVFYSITFFITLGIIYEILTLINFNLVSQAIFIFFVSVVTFFAYRIKQIVNEFRLEEKESILSPLFDFFFMPVLALGKFFSNEISRLNFFIFIFDFLIEAPFKFVFEIIEEWISFVRHRKEEII